MSDLTSEQPDPGGRTPNPLGGIMADAPTPREREKPEESEPAGAWSKKNAASSILSGPGF
jgi:hypothetical protein